jgi:hypothetical protein
VRANLRVVAGPVRQISPESPNVLKLSGERKRVRCSRALDGSPMRAPLSCRCGGSHLDEHS